CRLLACLASGCARVACPCRTFPKEGPACQLRMRSMSGTEAWKSPQCLFQLRNDLEQIPHQADVGDLEDRCLAVLVDCHDGAGILDAGEMLDRAGDADR